MLDFYDLITSDVAYFSTWQLHKNRVSKTRFITLINKMKSDQNIRGQPEKKKKKPRNRKERDDEIGEKKTTRTSEKMEIGEKKSPEPGPMRDPGRARAQAVAQTKLSREPRPLASEVSSLSL